MAKMVPQVGEIEGENLTKMNRDHEKESFQNYKTIDFSNKSKEAIAENCNRIDVIDWSL